MVNLLTSTERFQTGQFQYCALLLRMCKATLLRTMDERENLGEFMVSTFSLAIH